MLNHFWLLKICFNCHTHEKIVFSNIVKASFSSPGQSLGRAIVLPPALASELVSASVLAKYESFYVKVFLCDGQGAVRRAILSL